MEKRLNELRSMILTSVNVKSPNPGDQAYVSRAAFLTHCLVKLIWS